MPALGILVRIEILRSTKFRGDEDRRRRLLQVAPNQALAAAASIHVRRVKERHTRIDRRGEDSERLLVRDIPPICASELPAAKADFGDFCTGIAKRAFLHMSKGFGRREFRKIPARLSNPQ